MVKSLGTFDVVGPRREHLPVEQVGLGVAWVGTMFYRDHDVPRNSFIEISSKTDGRRRIFRIVRCASKAGLAKREIGLEWDDALALGLRIDKEEGQVEIHTCPWIRGVIPYLRGHPNPLIRYQFILSSLLALFGIGIGIIGLF